MLHSAPDAASGGPAVLPRGALVMGDVTGDEPVLGRIHSECLTGDALFSLRCDCGFQLQAAMENIAKAGRGVLLYVRQEGRGIGLLNMRERVEAIGGVFRVQSRPGSTRVVAQIGADAVRRLAVPALHPLAPLRSDAHPDRR